MITNKQRIIAMLTVLLTGANTIEAGKGRPGDRSSADMQKRASTDVHAVTHNKKTANDILIECALESNYYGMMLALDLRANVNYYGPDDRTALMICAMNNYFEGVEYLLEQKKADITQIDSKCLLALISTWKEESQDLLSYLIEKGRPAGLELSPEQEHFLYMLITCNPEDFNPLALAVMYNNFEAAKWILENGADTTHINSDCLAVLINKYQVEALPMLMLLVEYRFTIDRGIKKKAYLYTQNKTTETDSTEAVDGTEEAVDSTELLMTLLINSAIRKHELKYPEITASSNQTAEPASPEAERITFTSTVYSSFDEEVD
jgi:hypothetical protein